MALANFGKKPRKLKLGLVVTSSPMSAKVKISSP
jgi:hypothetical protein